MGFPFSKLAGAGEPPSGGGIPPVVQHRKAAVGLCPEALALRPGRCGSRTHYCYHGVGDEPTGRFIAALNRPIRRTIPPEGQEAAGVVQNLVRESGFAPEPSPSQGEMLLLHHGHHEIWRSHVRSRHDLCPSRGEMQHAWEHGVRGRTRTG